MALMGDIGVTADALRRELSGFRMDMRSHDWWVKLASKCRHNQESSLQLSSDHSTPLNYYAVFATIQKLLPKTATIVSEGANTMDIGRSYLLNDLPRRRLDAGSFGTMGVGLGFAVAAALYNRDHRKESRVICIEGDSAFGFSGMEIETIVRYNLPVIMIVVNNSGIYGGLPDELFEEMRGTLTLPPTSLGPAVRYEKILNMFGLEGKCCKTVPEIEAALKEALADESRPHFLNILINPSATRKAQQFDWLTRSKM